MFISNAYAQASSTAGGIASFIQTYGFFILMISVLYFFMIRPQMKRQKEQRKMLASMTKGDEVLTSSGILGKVMKVGEDYIGVELFNGVEVTMQKSAISAILPKGTIKSL
ncbi:preprotein translocase subunit YajC [Candidatus Vallotia cooleyia]|uniref:preprotein translocase subunit YajC n=1 Tax=Candidatus Vallotiella adelgis TaxID=1177211 RepID=UPI001D01442B|nr:preprotein translocase subunit YajC [Candidatus Vallotia cooleyia]UDG82171.1 Sec translocon accessory complex subunit YajC [Candidatus Vallotia cooleyia]